MDENPLADLVNAHCERTGDTLAAIAARGGISRQTLSGLVHRHGPKSLPRHQTLVALAKGLGLSVETVRRAASVTAYGEGDTEPVRRLVSVIVAHTEGLTDEDLEVVLATTVALKQHRVSA
jgi:lambda repressor-like predicted transcriptional regulator